MQIADRTIGIQNPTFVIAEIGVNHDGSVRRALELIDLAAAGGADAVKLQLFSADRLMNDAARFATYQQDRVAAPTPAAMLRQYELSTADVSAVVNAIRKRGLLPIATPFSLGDVDAAAALELPAIKIASPDLVNRPLLARAARTARPLLVSSGAATMAEVATAVGWLKELGASFALLHCVSSYPTPVVDANLRWIGELARFGVPVGYSDHTTEPLAGALAVAGGATIVEKHLTYDRAAAGPDHAASADPIGFAQYVKAIRLADTLRGSAGKRVLDCERDVRDVSRQSLVLARPLRAGQRVADADLIVQRPGSGIPAAQWPVAVGRTLRHDVAAGTMLSWEMLSDAA
jgi:N-acetylneuraminate synthase/N,N'-diacetyllegionaminate synthase